MATLQQHHQAARPGNTITILCTIYLRRSLMLYAATISMERMNGTEAGDDGQGIFCNDKTRNDNCDFKTGILSGLQMMFNF